MNKKNFIKTSDEGVIAELIAAGYTQVDRDSSGTTTFVNNGKAAFSEDSKKKMAFTNVLTMVQP